MGEGKHGIDRVAIGATLYPQGSFNSTGFVRWERDPQSNYYSFDLKWRDVAEARIIETLAGPIAEWLHTRRGRRPRLGGSDLECVDHYAAEHCRGQTPCLFGAKNVIQDRYIAYLEPRARLAVAEYWDRIEHVARALIERRELSGEEVARLIEEVEPGPSFSEAYWERFRFLGLRTSDLDWVSKSRSRRIASPGWSPASPG